MVPTGRMGPGTDVAEAPTSQLLAAPVAAVIADRRDLQEELLYLNQLLWKERTTATTADQFANSEYLAEYRRLFDSPRLRLKYVAALTIMPDEHPPAWWSQTRTHQVQRDAALIMIAAERHRRRHGQFPETADELVPALLLEVPIDPYTSKPLRYSVKDGRPTVDSVGLVEEDD